MAVLDLLRALQSLGIRPARLCQAVGLDTSSLEDPEARVSTGVVTRILALAEQLARDPWVGLHAGERAEPRGPVFYLIMSSPRIAEGLRRAERFCGLAVDTLRLIPRSEREVASLIFDVGDAAFSRSRHAMEYLLMASVTALRHAVGAEFRLREAHFRHRRAGGRDEAERCFGCPVFFGQREDRIVFPYSALWTATRFANRSIAQEIEKFAAALSARLTPRATIRERVEQATRALLAAGVRADSATVGKRLGMTSRTLQRRLADERTNFRALRDAVSWKAVEVLLSNPSLKIEAVALSVGFSDVSAFSKAFRRWKGYPPTRYRELTLVRSGRTPPLVAERRATT